MRARVVGIVFFEMRSDRPEMLEIVEVPDVQNFSGFSSQMQP